MSSSWCVYYFELHNAQFSVWSIDKIGMAFTRQKTGESHLCAMVSGILCSVPMNDSKSLTIFCCCHPSFPTLMISMMDESWLFF